MWFTLRIVLLGLWVGAMAGFAFLFAPSAFAHIGPTPAFAATIAACVSAITRFGDWAGVLGVAISVFAQLENRRMTAAIVGCIALAMVCGYIETSFIVPQMQTTPLQTPAYDALHRKSSSVYGAAMLLALAALVLSTLRIRSGRVTGGATNGR
jgi:hypothetical protein